jgi:hypothetical protein
MGTIASPWRYDAVARRALQSANLRRLAILLYTDAQAHRGVEAVDAAASEAAGVGRSIVPPTPCGYNSAF